MSVTVANLVHYVDHQKHKPLRLGPCMQYLSQL